MALILSGDTGPSFVQSAAMPTGSVIQTVQATTNSATSTSGATFVATNLAVSITPSSSSSKILVFGQIFVVGSVSQSQPTITLYRGASNLLGNYGFGDFYSNSGGYSESISAFSLIDSPSTTSSTTYTIYGRNPSGSGTAYFGDSSRFSVITAMEIKG